MVRWGSQTVYGCRKITLQQHHHTAEGWYCLTISFEGEDGSYCSLDVFSEGYNEIEVTEEKLVEHGKIEIIEPEIPEDDR